MPNKSLQVQQQRRAEKLTGVITSKDALNSTVLQLYSKGLSLREIGDRMSCSHQHVKRVLDTVDSLPTFDWSGELLSPQELKKRLRVMAKKHCGTTWLKVSKKYRDDWVTQCLSTLFESTEDLTARTRRFSRLLSSGPLRPGRPRNHEGSSLESSERKSKRAIPISQLVRRRADGSELSYTEVLDKVLADHLKILDGQSLSKTAFRPRGGLAPTGQPFEPCPICRRLTAYPITYTVKKDDSVFSKAVLGFKSKLCKRGDCAHKRVRSQPHAKSSSQ